MKILSVKLILLMMAFILAGLASASLWLNIAGGVLAVVMIVLIHLDNLDFCQKLDRIAKGEKNVKL